LAAIAAEAPAGAGLAPAGSAEDDEQIVFGSVDDPDGDGIEGVDLALEQGGQELDRTTTDADGAWEVAVPEPGTYDGILDLATLPEQWQTQQEAGERRSDVLVRPGRLQTRVPFPLISADEQQDPAPGTEEAGTDDDEPATDDAGAPPAEEDEGAIATEQPRG